MNKRDCKYPYKSDTVKSAIVLAQCTADLIFIKKYRVMLCGFGNMCYERRYTIFSCNLDSVISYMQERANALARRKKPEHIEVLIYQDCIQASLLIRPIYSWEYTPTYRD